MQPVEEHKKPRMRGANNRVGQGCRSTSCAALVLAAILSACAPVPDPSAGLSVEESIALIEQVQPSDVALEAIAETFALGGRATDVQRENLTADLIGHRVEWDIPVYEVSYSEGRYEVLSQPIAVQDPEAAALIRVMAIVIPTSPADEELLQAVKTDDVIRVRGIVQVIRLRTIVAVVPAIVVVPADSDVSNQASGRLRDDRVDSPDSAVNQQD